MSDLSATPATAAPPAGDLAARLRGFGPVGLLAILVILGVGVLTMPAVTGVVILLWAWLSRTPPRDLGFRRPASWPGTIVLGIGIGIALKVFMKALVMPLLGGPAVNPVYHFLEGNTAALPQTIALVVLSAGFGEEMVFRGWMLERFVRLLGPGRGPVVVAIAVSTVLFALAHLPDQELWGAEQAFLVGAAYALLYAWRRQILLVMIAHAAFDVTAVAMIYWGWEARVAHLLFRG